VVSAHSRRAQALLQGRAYRGLGELQGGHLRGHLEQQGRCARVNKNKKNNKDKTKDKNTLRQKK
jgi:hypothetical protein